MTTRRGRENTRPAAQDPDDDWETTSGLADNFDFWITNAYFGFDEEYGADIPVLFWEGESPDLELERPIIWSIGSGWEVKQRGQTVEHEKRVKFVNMSGYGRLLEAIKQFPDLDMRKRGNAKSAKVWIGLGFHLNDEVFHNPQPAVDRGLPETFSHLMPTAFLGFAEGEEQLATTARPASVARSARNGAATTPMPSETDEVEETTTTAPAPPSRSTGGRSGRRGRQAEAAPSLDEQLRKLALETDSIEEFQEAALELPGLEDNQALYADVLDDSDDGFWVRVGNEEEAG